MKMVFEKIAHKKLAIEKIKQMELEILIAENITRICRRELSAKQDLIDYHERVRDNFLLPSLASQSKISRIHNLLLRVA